MPVPMVFATWVPIKKAATKLKKAAHQTAYFGFSTRVETTVAMELAASWNPLMKSNTRAMKIMKQMKRRELSIFQDDSLNDIRCFFAPVRGLADLFKDLLAAEQFDWIVLAVE